LSYATKYSKVKQNQKKTLRGFFRGRVLDLLSFKQASFSSILNPNPQVQFIYVHHFFKDELAHLDMLLKKLSRNYTFISYSEGVNRVLNATIDKPYLVFSSDDGFKNNLEALKLFKKYGVSCCFFVNPLTINGLKADENKVFCNMKLNFPNVEFLNWEDVNVLLENGHEIGSHGWSHTRFNELHSSKAFWELEESYHTIKKRTGQKEIHFAFPYGRFENFNRDYFNQCFSIGYKSCATAERGSHYTKEVVDQDQLYLRRDHIVLDWPVNHSLYFLKRNLFGSRFENLYPNKIQ